MNVEVVIKVDIVIVVIVVVVIVVIVGITVCPSVRPSVGPSPIFSKSVYALPHTQTPPLTIIRCVLASL